MLADILSGHVTLADWLFLIGIVLLVIDGLLKWAKRHDPTSGALLPVGIAFLGAGWLVL